MGKDRKQADENGAPARRQPILRAAFHLIVLVAAFIPLPSYAETDLPDIVIVGATARTAEAMIPIAIEGGYRVIGIARRPEAVAVSDERLTLIKGDVYDRASIAAVLTGTEIVVAVFGPRVDLSQEVAEMDLFSTGYANVIEAMKAKGNKRLIATSSIGAQRVMTEPPGDDAPRTDKWLWQIRGIYEDTARMEALVRASGLDFTILRPAQLMPEPSRNDLRIIVDEDAPEFTLITYEDFAQFLFDEISSPQYVGRTVGLYSDRTIQYGVNFLTEDQ